MNYNLHNILGDKAARQNEYFINLFFKLCLLSLPKSWANNTNNNARSASVGFKSDERLGKMGMRGRYRIVPHHTIPIGKIGMGGRYPTVPHYTIPIGKMGMGGRPHPTCAIWTHHRGSFFPSHRQHHQHHLRPHHLCDIVAIVVIFEMHLKILKGPYFNAQVVILIWANYNSSYAISMRQIY